MHNDNYNNVTEYNTPDLIFLEYANSFVVIYIDFYGAYFSVLDISP